MHNMSYASMNVKIKESVLTSWMALIIAFVWDIEKGRTFHMAFCMRNLWYECDKSREWTKSLIHTFLYFFLYLFYINWHGKLLNLCSNLHIYEIEKVFATRQTHGILQKFKEIISLKVGSLTNNHEKRWKTASFGFFKDESSTKEQKKFQFQLIW